MRATTSSGGGIPRFGRLPGHTGLVARALAALYLLVVTATPLFGFPMGPPGGFSGGPEGYGASCTSCHAFSQGPGRVSLDGITGRYRPGAVYDLIITIADPTKSAGGFEISVESASAGFTGNLEIIDAVETQFAFGNTNYVSHTQAGYVASSSAWSGNGNEYAFPVRWNAPLVDTGAATVFVAGNATNEAGGAQGDHYYFAYESLQAAVAYDADGDGDVDLADAGALQNCFDSDDTEGMQPCGFLDGDLSGTVDDADVEQLVDDMGGPASAVPSAYARADVIRGGQLYDKWWIVNGASEPADNHPLYPDFPFQSGSTTHRCKECHGWDYLGVNGAYGTGFHYTGIKGVRDTTLSPQAMFFLLAQGDSHVPHGHDMLALGMTESDLWDVVKFVLEGTIDTSPFIDENDDFVGQGNEGVFTYQDTCYHCHGGSGNMIPAGDPTFLGDVATENPWELMHKVRFSHPGTSMPPGKLLRLSPQDVADLGVYVQTLPVE